MSDSVANGIVKNGSARDEQDTAARIDALFFLLGTDLRQNIHIIVSQARDIFSADLCLYLPLSSDGEWVSSGGTLSEKALRNLSSWAEGMSVLSQEKGLHLLDGESLPQNMIQDCSMTACIPITADKITVGMLITGFKTQREFGPDDHHAARCLSGALGLQERLQRKFKDQEHQAGTGRMARQVAHDLNNILAGLVSYPELILMQMDASDPFQGPVSLMHDAGLQAAEMVSDFLLLARPGNLQEFYRISPSASARAYCQTGAYAQLVDSFPLVRFAFFIDPDLPDMPGTDEFLPKIFTSLLHHSAQNIDGPGQVTVTLKECLPSALPLPCEKGIFLRIEDTGTRTDEKDLIHLFDPFYAKKTMGRQGTGLGLAAVRKLVRDQGGVITVSSSNGRGTRFDAFFKTLL